VDFEKRILEIYQTCRQPDDIKAAFDALQSELSEQIDERMTEARQSILDNFDEEVSRNLKDCQQNTIMGLDRFSQWLYTFFIMQGAEQVEPLDQLRFAYTLNGERKTYNLHWRDAEEQHDEFLRRDGELISDWITEVMEADKLPEVSIRFTHSTLPSAEHISFLDSHPFLKSGIISIDKLTHKGIENEEHLIFSVITNDGTPIDDDMLDRIMRLEATVVGECSPETAELIAQRQERIVKQKAEIAERNMRFFLEQEAQMEAYTEDLKDGLQKYLKAARKEIAEKKKERRSLKDTGTLEEMLNMSAEINKLETTLKKKQRELYDEEDRLERERDAFLEDIRSRLNGEIETETIMTFSFEIV